MDYLNHSGNVRVHYYTRVRSPSEAFVSVVKACTHKMRKGLEYLHPENHRIKDKGVRIRDQKSQFPFKSSSDRSETSSNHKSRSVAPSGPVYFHTVFPSCLLSSDKARGK